MAKALFEKLCKRWDGETKARGAGGSERLVPGHGGCQREATRLPLAAVVLDSDHHLELVLNPDSRRPSLVLKTFFILYGHLPLLCSNYSASAPRAARASGSRLISPRAT